MLNFDINRSYLQKDFIVTWIRQYFEETGASDKRAIVGISGGKDSAVVAALCVEALGKDRVIGIEMPNGNQADIDDADAVINHLGIESYECNIEDPFDSILYTIEDSIEKPTSERTKINLAPRLRMAVLYAYAQTLDGRVANTCNLSEDMVGYSTLWGDSVGDFAPIAQLTVSEVIGVGRALGLPKEILEKPPADGLCGKTDEENLGLTYDDIDTFVIEYSKPSPMANKIEELMINSQFKRKMIRLPCPPDELMPRVSPQDF